MTAKEILFKVAEQLPHEATLLDAINQIEMHVGLEENAEIARSLRQAVPAAKPEWLYASPSRLHTILRQTRHAPSHSFCE